MSLMNKQRLETSVFEAEDYCYGDDWKGEGVGFGFGFEVGVGMEFETWIWINVEVVEIEPVAVAVEVSGPEEKPGFEGVCLKLEVKWQVPEVGVVEEDKSPLEEKMKKEEILEDEDPRPAVGG